MLIRLCLIMILGFCSGSVLSAEWYVGGTLHRADSSAWRAATYQNRLATSSDFVVAIKSARNMTSLRKDSEKMEECVSESARDKSVNIKASELGALCAILMGW